ncbi:hypothetical protein Tco_1533181 [Tanacetum coccineum]
MDTHKKSHQTEDNFNSNGDDIKKGFQDLQGRKSLLPYNDCSRKEITPGAIMYLQQIMKRIKRGIIKSSPDAQKRSHKRSHLSHKDRLGLRYSIKKSSGVSRISKAQVKDLVLFHRFPMSQRIILVAQAGHFFGFDDEVQDVSSDEENKANENKANAEVAERQAGDEQPI